ncbi:MAG: hypothetical protein KDC52_16020, partial [Ignavibacteriae bacterium]|nr:hypothetical protein [Ignavibacteriota bacterium]
YEETKNKYSDADSIEFVEGVNNYYYTENYKDFSDSVFSVNNIGVVPNPLDAKNRFVVIWVKKIYPIGYKEFEDVKEQLIKEIKKEKLKSEYAKLLLNLNQGEYDVNEEGIISLKDKYVN